MVATVDVVNVALRLVGGNDITSLTDGSKNANIAADIYEELRDDLLRSHNWNFATKRAKLARSATAPTYEFDYAYPVPSDWIRTIAVSNNDEGFGMIEYQEEIVAGQRCILSDADDVYIRYVSSVTDPNLMSADFRRAWALAMARDLAIPIASSNVLQDQLRKQADRVLMRARSSDGMGGFPNRRPRGSWAESRGGRWPMLWND